MNLLLLLTVKKLNNVSRKTVCFGVYINKTYVPHNMDTMACPLGVCINWVPLYVCSGQDHLSHLKGCKWGYSFLHRKRLEPRVLPRQHHRCHSASYTIYDIITFLICIIH